jgi:hypothetical protein
MVVCSSTMKCNASNGVTGDLGIFRSIGEDTTHCWRTTVYSWTRDCDGRTEVTIGINSTCRIERNDNKLLNFNNCQGSH